MRETYEESLCINDADPASTWKRLSENEAFTIIADLFNETNDLGCWLSNLVTDRENGYGKKNLSKRNSTTAPGYKVGNIHLHRTAVIAAGRGRQLASATGKWGSHQVSHLCHNKGCFNPDHVVVETTALNNVSSYLDLITHLIPRQARNTCQGAIITMTGGGAFHPCIHGQSEHYRTCILRTVHLAGNRYVQNSTDL